MDAYLSFSEAIRDAGLSLLSAPLVKTGFWQGIDASKRPDMATYELLNYSFQIKSCNYQIEDLVHNISPDLPWADDHFCERVSRQPLNPPPSEAWWPHAPKGNSQFKISGGIFSHTYPERYWPKTAGGHDGIVPMEGIRFPYGDLDDLVSMLQQDPHTRQAYLPVWFPEDLGAPMNQRKPCTLGYHFIMRDDQLHIVYYIRSCDFYRHFKNDIYLTVRLQHWVLDQLRERDMLWHNVHPGSFTMHITSLHLFVNDYMRLRKEYECPVSVVKN